MYTKVTGEKLTASILIYVDDLMIITRSEEEEQNIKAYLNDNFGQMSWQEGPKFSFIGTNVTVDHDADAVTVDCSGFIEKMAVKFGVTSTKETPTPSNFNVSAESPSMDPESTTDYRSAVMSLMYVAKRVRPDVLFVTSLLATKCESPTVLNFKYATHVMAYLKGTSNKGIKFTSTESPELKVFADASFNAHPDGCSHTGVICTLLGGPILFKSKKQRLVVKSTTDAELYACDEGIECGLWLSNLCVELGHHPGSPLKVHQDNQAAITLMTKGSLIKMRGSVESVWALSSSRSRVVSWSSCTLQLQ